MRVQASAGRDRKKDLKKNVYSLKLTASDETEEQALAVLLKCIENDGLFEIVESVSLGAWTKPGTAGGR